MACVISAPASSSGKTILSLILAAWARSKGKSIQTFKVGPDYLDPQQLSLVTKRPCRNLDLTLSGPEWVQNSFSSHKNSAELTLIEGVMGLFDGVGSSREGSTSDIARLLNLPIVLIINASGQAASIGALVKGFRDTDLNLNIEGVVLNNVNTSRHRSLLTEVLEDMNVRVLGCLPNSEDLHLKSKNLGLSPPHELGRIEARIKLWKFIAEKYLDLNYFEKLLASPNCENKKSAKIIERKAKNKVLDKPLIAIAEDKAFHFNYPETKECLIEMGMEILTWEIIKDEPIPKEVKGVIIPGGFPEEFAEEISQCKRSLNSLQKIFCKRPIYAECGGMLILGNAIEDINGNEYPMTGLLPFKAREGSLKVGYRRLTAHKRSLILSPHQKLVGHEFHRWHLSINENKKDLSPPWLSTGWGLDPVSEGWSNNLLHASWIHLHWPSSEKILDAWCNSIEAIKGTRVK
ncbi:cobyrinate a,c-diamide synthase [Prochlorococcus marinus]|uniref:Putative Cobyrinic acid a,c-diamide synthase n=1 Tax=Prochlorococcus marinus (strain MIT 9211) TaxID=93059 RepID=A9BB35_PROM4|nr:cobyrinate a,c-diamide synthase [Prochlorococcus marinus]ABX09047.1 putative Cobyrinic acid a,c-diamide synthase [Prochlorococcus marinus str. MIT 9211]